MLILRKEAEEDIKNAYEWYEEKRSNLGESLMAELDAMFVKISDHPEIYAMVIGNVRRALCKRFPYAIYFNYFIERPSNIVVLAVLHQRRSPLVWQKRK